jgi:UDP-glucose 4-epimerase
MRNSMRGQAGRRSSCNRMRGRRIGSAACVVGATSGIGVRTGASVRALAVLNQEKASLESQMKVLISRQRKGKLASGQGKTSKAMDTMVWMICATSLLHVHCHSINTDHSFL